MKKNLEDCDEQETPRRKQNPKNMAKAWIYLQ